MALFLVLLLTWSAKADDVEPPVAGRPELFSGAVGDYRLTTRAAPTELSAEDALTLTVRLTGTGPLRGVVRPDLRRLPRFAKVFHIENGPERDLPKEHAREYDYRLRPRSADVKEVPALPFVFFKPGLVPASRGYQTRYAPAIPLTVRPRAEVSPTAVQGGGEPVRAPDDLYAIVAGDAVLRQEARFTLPAWVFFVGLYGPPLVCLGWQLVWLWRHPKEARLLWERRRAAARHALHALGKLGRAPTEQRAGGAAAVVVDYLRQRANLAALQPNPREIMACLRTAGLPAAAAERVADFFAACDLARYAPGLAADGRDWPDEARRLVLDLEAQPWPS
jgi:hypothetical protein